MTNQELRSKVISLQEEISLHPVFSLLTNADNIRIFMEYHIFAVMDFMSLLKALQIGVTCVKVPWRPPPFPAEVVRFVNELVLDEESDVDQDGNAISHYQLYIDAMEAVGADTRPAKRFIDTAEFINLPKGIQEFIGFHVRLSYSARLEGIAGAFFFGREQVIPKMFSSIVKVLEEKPDPSLDKFFYYLKRHIELDSGSHAEFAEKCLVMICKNDPQLMESAYETSIKSLKLRKKLWDRAQKSIEKGKRANFAYLEKDFVRLN